MKKFLCCMMAAIVFLLSPLSAFASTTEAMLMFSLQQDEYAVMPLAVYDAVTVGGGSGWYDKNTDTFVYANKNVSVSDNKVPSIWQSYYSKNYTSQYLPIYVFHLSGDNMGTTGVTNRYMYSPLRLHFGAGSVSTPNWFYANPSGLDIFKSYAVIRMAGTVQIGGSHWSVSGDNETYALSTIPLSSIYTSSSNFNGSEYDLGIDFTLNIDNPDVVRWYYGGYHDSVLGDYNPDNSFANFQRFYNARITDITVYTVLNLSSFVNGDYNLSDTLNNHSVLPVFSGLSDADLYIISDDTVLNPDSDTNIINSLSNSISSMGSNISKTVSTSFNQVKIQITQSTNTITSRIQTMETNVVDGLNNVISSAQQNTQNIINAVTQKVDEVKIGITEVKDSILDLPNKIQEMLLGLIVPDSDTMADKYSEFSGLLEEKLGVIYQIPMMLFDFFDTIVNAATTPQTSLTLPAFTLPWIDGSTLTVWNSMEYKIIPDGLEVLSDLIKTVTSMTVVVLTFNSVKRAYERFLRS